MPSRDQLRAAARRLAEHPTPQVLRRGFIRLRDSFFPTPSQQGGILFVLTLFLLGLIVMLARRA